MLKNLQSIKSGIFVNTLNINLCRSGDMKYTKPQILNILKEIRQKISRQHEIFDLVTDDDLIESTIYKILSLEKQYNYFFKKARNM